MLLFDFNVGIGRGASLSGGAFDTASDLLEEMTRLGIGEALVYHRMAAEADVEKGNRRLIELLRGNLRLHPCWAMAPAVFGDLPEASSWVRIAAENGVRAVRLFPAHSLYTLAEWSVGPICSALQSAAMPVVLDFGPGHWSERRIPWRDVKALCEAYPQLCVVVIGTTIGDMRDAVALLTRLPNLLIETHRFIAPDALALAAEKGLASQLVFGTGMPQHAGECSAALVVSSGLEPAELRAVASGNARRVLGIESVSPAEGRHADLSQVHPGLVVDVHGHYGAWERTITPVRTPADVVKSMKRCGINKLVGSSFSAIHGEMRLGNEETAEYVRQYPDFLHGYCVINPHYPSETMEELTRCFKKNQGFVGLKFHCQLHGVQLQHAGYQEALSYANQHELPVLVHGGGQDEWEAVAQRYPRASFIMAHGCAWDGIDPAGASLYGMARHVPNLYVDVAGSAAYRGALRSLIDLVGIDKILYGSDFPIMDFAFEVGRITLGDFTGEERAALCAGNALRIFRRLQASQQERT